MSFRIKTILGIIALIESILLVALVFSSIDYLRSSNHEALKRRADSIVKLFASAATDAVQSSDLARLKQLSGQLLHDADIVYVRILDNGKVLAEAGDESALNRPFLADNSVESVVDGIYEVTVTNQDGVHAFGRIELGLSTDTMTTVVYSASKRIITLAFLAIVLVGLLFWLLGNYLATQLADLKTAVNLTAKGRTSPRLKVQGKDELAKVAQAFNRMSERVDSTYRRLKLALLEVRLKREWLQSVVDSELDGLIAIDTVGRITLFNHSAEQMFGYLGDEVLGCNVNILMPKPYQSTHNRYLQNYLKTGVKRIIGDKLEIVGRRKDGTVFPLELSVTELNSSSEQGFIGLTRDITERKRLETDLLNESEKNRILLRNASDGIHILDLNGNLVEASDAFCNMLGYPRGQTIGMNIGTWDAQFKPEELIPYIRNQFEQHQRVQFETLLRHRDGRLFPVEISGYPLVFNNQPLMFYSARDITERKILDDQVRFSENMKKSMLDSSLDAIITTDMEGRIVEFNPSASAIFGFSPEHVLGKTIAELIIPQRFQSDYLQGVANFNATGQGLFEDQRIELIALRKSGEEFPIEISITPIILKQHTFFTAFIRDISKTKKAEEALRLGREQAEQANQMKSQFLATMSHEIRTPLNAILGTQELLADTSLTNVQKEYLKIANDAGKTLSMLINDILDLSKVEAGKLELDYSVFNPVNTVNEVMEIIRVKADEKNLTLNSEIANDVAPSIYGDPWRLRQVLLNLLFNAVKFTESGGITLRLAPKIDANEKNILLFEVIDTGIGIDNNAKQRLFQSFVQVDPSDTRKFGGTGLGLAICKRLVELWDGEIGLDSEPKIGSRFWFSFGESAYSLQNTCLNKSVEQEQTKASAGGVRILLVEDSRLNQVVIATMLGKAGHQVEIAENGSSAIAKVRDSNYDLIFMDISMPDMNGMDATCAIRQLGGAAATVPIIAMTAHAVKGYREQCLKAGMNDYATKPIGKKQLLELVEHWNPK